MFLPLLLLTGCFADPPVLEAVTPSELQPGEEIILQGKVFGTDLSVTLTDGPTTVVLPVNVESDTRAVGVIDDQMPPGHYTVHIAREGHDAADTRPVEVWTADSEPPCNKRYSLSTETVRTQRKVAFERTFLDRPSTRQVYMGDELAGIEHTASAMADGRTCSAIWLHTADGGRWLIADDAERDLETTAGKIAEVLGIPIR